MNPDKILATMNQYGVAYLLIVGMNFMQVCLESRAVPDSFTDLTKRKQPKRARTGPPAVRWQAYLNTLAWAESQSTVRRNTKAACLAHQQQLLAQLAAAKQNPNRIPSQFGNQLS